MIFSQPLTLIWGLVSCTTSLARSSRSKTQCDPWGKRIAHPWESEIPSKAPTCCFLVCLFLRQCDTIMLQQLLHQSREHGVAVKWGLDGAWVRRFKARGVWHRLSGVVCRGGMLTETFSVPIYLGAGSTSIQALSPWETRGRGHGKRRRSAHGRLLNRWRQSREGIRFRKDGIVNTAWFASWHIFMWSIEARLSFPL